jgi:SAM-dependent methyltransferase
MDEPDIWGDLVGDPWIEFADLLDEHSRPFGVAAIEALGPVVGARVLDVGCGTGRTTWDLADRVGPGGRVIGVDQSAPFVAAARAAGDARTSSSSRRTRRSSWSSPSMRCSPASA